MRKLRSFWIVTAIATLLVALVLFAKAEPNLTLRKGCGVACECSRKTTTAVVPATTAPALWPASFESTTRVEQ